METELLKTFLEVEKTRHFGRAAENLYLTQAAVSSRIRQLENLFGVSLFNRHRNNINLTAEGERLKPHPEAVMTALSRALQESALGKEQSQQLAIGGTPNLWDSLLQDYLHRVYRQYPGISLRAVAQDRESLTRQLLSHTLDIAVIFDPPKVEELKVEKLIEMELILVTSYEGAGLEDVFEQGYIQTEWGTSFNILHAQMTGGATVSSLHTSTGRIALDFMLENGGSAFLPESIVNPSLGAGRLHTVVKSKTVKRDVYAAYLNASDKLETLANVTELFASVIPEAAPTIQP